jgi:hypothetical protein
LTAGEDRLAGELPQNLVALDSFDDLIAWALVQDGACVGYKPRAGETAPVNVPLLQCEFYSQLLMTTDGGISWSEITPAS